jgi:hypothetical protein
MTSAVYFNPIRTAGWFNGSPDHRQAEIRRFARNCPGTVDKNLEGFKSW